MTQDTGQRGLRERLDESMRVLDIAQARSTAGADNENYAVHGLSIADVRQAIRVLREAAACLAEEARKLALAVRLVQERQAQHRAALEGWKEPDGYLVPTEPDPGERHGIRAMLAAAIVEDGYALGAMGAEAIEPTGALEGAKRHAG